MCNVQLGGLSSSMTHGAGVPHMIPKSIKPIAAGFNTHQIFGEYGLNLIQDETQPHWFSDENQWVNAERATSANFENVPPPSYINLPPHTAVVSTVPPLGQPNYFNQFYKPNLASWFPVTATPTPADCNTICYE